MTQKKNDSINSKHGRVVDNNGCVVFSTFLVVFPTRFPNLILCPR